MKQTSGFISTYSADVFGVCSALFELGGMVVMHDASGCNSTYTTHDEPRWYDMDSMVYISGLTEIEAIMGDSSKLIGDVVRAAKELNPKFIALAGTPIPAMTGFDMEAAAFSIEEQTGIPVFGFDTTGMKSYIRGAQDAFERLAERIVIKDIENTKEKSVNILGLTPLDFSVNGFAESVCGYFKDRGFDVVSSWAMGSGLDDISRAGSSTENIIVSETGLKAALKLKELFGTPYKMGIPMCGEYMDVSEWYTDGVREEKLIEVFPNEKKDAEILILGEGISTLSLARYYMEKKGMAAVSFASTDSDEEEIIGAIDKYKNLKIIIADPLFERLIKMTESGRGSKGLRFIPMPHEAFSGRIYRNGIYNLCLKCPEIN